MLSLTLSVVLFVAASSFGMYLKNAAESTVVGTDYDLCFYSQDIDEEEMFRLYDEFKVVPEFTTAHIRQFHHIHAQ